MRSLKSGLFGLFAAGLLVSAAFVGCAESETGDVEPTAGEGENPNPLPESNPPGDPPKDAGKDAKDSGKTDAAKDAGPPPPNPGDKCAKVDEVFEKLCGKCGKQKALCLTDGAGGGKVSEYGPCEGEIGQCAIGSTQECGNCGTSTCSQSCNWGVCSNQPANACPKNTTEYSTAGCASGQYRNRTCSETCQWGNFSATCAEPANANKLYVAGAGATTSGNYSLVGTRVSKRQPLYSCGASATLTTTVDHPYELIEIRNDTGKSANVTVTVTGTPIVYSALAHWPNNLPPSTDAELRGCTNAAYGYVYPSSPTSSYWPNLSAFTIPAAGRVVVRLQAYYGTTGAPTGYITTGAFTLNVKTNSLN